MMMDDGSIRYWAGSGCPDPMSLFDCLVVNYLNCSEKDFSCLRMAKADDIPATITAQIPQKAYFTNKSIINVFGCIIDFYRLQWKCES